MAKKPKKPKTVADLSVTAIQELAQSLELTSKNVYRLVEVKYGVPAVSEDIFDRLEEEQGLKRCTSCSEWRRDIADEFCGDCCESESESESEE